MKEELRREISAELASGSKISAASVQRLMRKHSISREGLWKCVRSVMAEKVEVSESKVQLAETTPESYDSPRIPASVIDEPMQWPTTAKQDEALTQILDPQRQSDFMKVMDNIGKISPQQAKNYFRKTNPFLMLRTKRQYKMETEQMPTEEELFELQEKIMVGMPIIELTPELQQMILSL